MGDCLVSLTIFGFAYLSYSVSENLSSVSATHSMNALMDGNLEEYGEYIIKRQLYTLASQVFHVIYRSFKQETTDALASWMNCLWLSTLSFNVSLNCFSTSITNRASEVTIRPKHPLFPKYGF